MPVKGLCQVIALLRLIDPIYKDTYSVKESLQTDVVLINAVIQANVALNKVFRENVCFRRSPIKILLLVQGPSNHELFF